MVAVNRTLRKTSHCHKLHPDVQSKYVDQHFSGLPGASDIKNYDNFLRDNFEDKKVFAAAELLKS